MKTEGFPAAEIVPDSRWQTLMDDLERVRKAAIAARISGLDPEAQFSLRVALEWHLLVLRAEMRRASIRGGAPSWVVRHMSEFAT